MQTPSILTQEIITSPTPGGDLATALIKQTKTGAIPPDGFLIMLHSASSEQPETLVNILSPVFQQLIDGKPPRAK